MTRIIVLMVSSSHMILREKISDITSSKRRSKARNMMFQQPPVNSIYDDGISVPALSKETINMTMIYVSLQVLFDDQI